MDLELVLHHLRPLPEAKPFKQKLRKMHSQITLLVNVELPKLLDVGFIRPIDYAEWISSLISVTNPNGGIHIYIDLRDLNRACPKDDFPLPNIDMRVDLTVRHKMLSLMDDFSGYN